MIFSYKGYAGESTINKDTNVLTGEVLNIRDVITFEGKTVTAARQAFRDSVDDYLEFCFQLGRTAQR